MVDQDNTPKAIALTYNLSSGSNIALGAANNLSQNEMFNLSKQRNLKNKLKNNLMQLDQAGEHTIAIDKFDIECKGLGIHISKQDFDNIVLLYKTGPELGDDSMTIIDYV